MEAEADKLLMLRVKSGDLEAFETLYAKYSRPLMGFFYRLVFDASWAEDLMQDTFFRLWKGRRHYRPTGRFTTYLFQIAKNHWLNERDKRRRRISPVSLEGLGEESGNGMRDAFSSKEPGPIDEAMGRELEEKLAEAMDALSDKLRIVFVMGQVKGMRYADISNVLGIPVGTVKSRMSNAEKAIRARITPFLGKETA